MSENKEIHPELSRDLTLFHITMMGLGMMIGAGVFIGIGNTIHESGPGGLLLTFALNGLIAFFTAMSFAELSSAIPRAGGAYNFARIAFGRGPSFVAGWMEWFASSVAGSLYAVVFGTYTMEFFYRMGILPESWLPLSIKLIALFVALLFIYINYRGTSETGKIGAFFTLGQMMFVLAIGVIGAIVFFTDPQRIENFEPFIHPDGWTNILVTMGFIYVAFEGFEVIAQAGDETIDPKRNIPKAMLYSVCIVTLTYLFVSFATVVAVSATDPELVAAGQAPWEWIGSFLDTGFGQAVSKLLPGKFLGYIIVTLAVVFSSTSALNATLYSATRASYALGRDRMMPESFSKISKKRKTPYIALFYTGGLLIFVALALPTKDVASSASIMFICLFFLVNLSVIKVRLDMGEELSYGFLMPLFPLFPILAIICQAVLVMFLHEMSMIAWVVAPIWIILGIFAFIFYGKQRAVPTADEVHVFEEETSAYSGRSKIMISVANPANAEALVHQVEKIAKADKADIEVLHMVPVPTQTPLQDAPEYMQEGKEGITKAFDILSPKFPISKTVRYCRSIPRGIVSTVKEKKADKLVIGWHGVHKSRGFKIGSTIDPIIDKSHCDVIVMKGLEDKIFKSVLVPLAGGPNARLALETASVLSEEGSKIVVFTAGKLKRSNDIQRFIAKEARFLGIRPEDIEVKTVFTNDIVQAILDESQAHDLLVLGATARPLAQRITQDSIPEQVARKSEKPLVMVKSDRFISSRIRRWI